MRFSNKSLKFVFSVIALPIAVPFAAAAQTATAQANDSLQAAIEAALSSEPAYQAQGAMLSVAQARYHMAKAASRSNIGIQGSYGATRSDFGAGNVEIYPRNLAIAWERRLFDGGRALSQVSASEFNVAAQNGEYANARNMLIAEVAESYANVVTATKGKIYAQDNLAANQRYARDAGLQFQAGEIPVSEKAMADAALANAQAMFANANGNLTVAKANLRRLTGRDFDNANFENVPAFIPNKLEDAKSQALENHPMLAAAKARFEAANAMVRASYAERSPNISIQARASSVRDQFLAGYRNDEVGAFVNFSMPLYTSGRISSGIDLARANRDAARAQNEAISRQIIMGVEQAYAGFDAANANLVAARAGLNARQIARNSVEAEMRVGQRPIKDLLDAQRDLTAAQTEMARAEGALITAKYRVIAAIGTTN